MRIGQQSDDKIVVIIKTAARDMREKVEKDGKLVTNKQFEKIVYETVESIDVYDAKPAEVKEAVLRGLSAAAGKK